MNNCDALLQFLNSEVFGDETENNIPDVSIDDNIKKVTEYNSKPLSYLTNDPNSEKTAIRSDKLSISFEIGKTFANENIAPVLIDDHHNSNKTITFDNQSISSELNEKSAGDNATRIAVSDHNPDKVVIKSNKFGISFEIDRESASEFDYEVCKNSGNIALKEKCESQFNILEIEKKSHKYSSYGYEINKNLKENKFQSRDGFQSSSSWKAESVAKKEKSGILAVSNSPPKTNDVYAEPVFGLRLLNPLVSSQFIKSKMEGKLPVAISRISHHLKIGDKNADWVLAGTVVFKTGLKTSQKGSQYCLWKISDLKFDLKQVTVYLFAKAGSELWKVSVGTVVAILNAAPFNNKEENSKSNEDTTLTVKNPDQVMIWGSSKDYGICKGMKANGDSCTAFVNKSQCEFCIYHVNREYNKYTSKRTDLQASFSNGHRNLRNKVLGKSEVFYGGKSYAALKPAPRNNKIIQKDKCTSNLLSSFADSATVQRNSSKLAECDSKRLETFVADQPSTSQCTENGNPIEKPALCSRLNLIKAASQKMIETGKPTHISAVNMDKKKHYITFASVFGFDDTEIQKDSTNVTESSQLCRTEKSTSNNISTPTTKNVNNNVKQLENNEELKRKIMLHNKRKDGNTRQIPSRLSEKILTPKECTVLPKKTELEVVGSAGKLLRKSKVENRGEQLAKKFHYERSGTKQLSARVEKIPSLPESPLLSDNIELDIVNSDGKSMHKSTFNMLLNRSRSQCEMSIHKKRAVQAKMSAINVIKKKGGISKTNPNQVKPDISKRKSLKRPAESPEEDTNDSIQKSILSERFIELMNATSKYQYLAQLEEDKEQQNYFNKMEKKEQLEEKMLATYKVPCKAVSCLKCKYKWFSASDLCKAEGHPLKVIDTIKRFFKCHNCSNRIVSLEIFPLICCKQCGSSSWLRAPMIREKIDRSNQLSIRGDEETFMLSSSQNANLNLLVP